MAVLKSSPCGVSQAIIGLLIPPFRNEMASSSNAVPNQSAPADSAAFATATSP